jgi:hypothetical protein
VGTIKIWFSFSHPFSFWRLLGFSLLDTEISGVFGGSICSRAFFKVAGATFGTRLIAPRITNVGFNPYN